MPVDNYVYIILYMKRYVSASEARAKFLQLIEQARSGDQIVVTRRGTPAVVLIDVERLETLTRIAGLWQDPETMTAIREALEDVAKGRVLRTKKHVPPVRELLRTARRQGLLRG